MIEYRLDYCKDTSDIDVSQFNSYHVLTYRDSQEGGKNKLTDRNKVKLYKKILDNSSAWLDCEYHFLMRNSGLNIPPERLILSMHTTSSDLKAIKEFLFTKIKAGYYKLALKCSGLSCFDEVLKLAPTYVKDRLILIPLHPAPLTYRLLFRLYGSQATYVCLNEKTTLNQPSLNLANACSIDSITSETELYGIIGNRKVAKSLSVYMLNYCFQKNKTDNAMIPILAGNPDDALKIIDWLKEKANLKGIAITMPFKKKIPYMITGERIIANSWLIQTNKFINTDETAMNLALDTLKLPRSSSVLILGKGATSKVTQRVLEQKGFENYQVLSRQQLKQRREKRPSKKKDLVFFRRFDLLINCTPFGLKAEDKPSLLPKFDALIDLPYGVERTTLVNYSIKNDLPHVSGTIFWKWQAIEQSEFFRLNLRLEQRLI